VVDDLAEDRARIEEIVSQDVAPAEVEEIGDHVSFFRALRENRYDIVITEQDLHWSSGQEVLHAVKSLRPAVPVIMVARRADDGIAAAAFREGLDAYVPKSGELAVRLRASVRSAFRRLEFEERIDGLEDRIEHLLDRLDVAVFRTTAAGELLEGNPAFQRLFGAIIGPDGLPRGLAALFQDPSAYHALEARLASEGQVRSHEARLRRADGSLAWVALSVTLRKGPGAVVIADGLAEDVTAAREAGEALEQARNDLRSVFEHSGAAVAVLESDGTIAMVNSAFERFSGFPRRELEGVESWSRFLPIEDRDRLTERRRLQLGAGDGNTRSGSHDFIGRDGRRCRVHATEAVLPGGTRTVVSLVDISERQRIGDQLLHNAFHDALTGLPNRLSLFERLASLVDRAASRDGEGTALILLDLDAFKDVNDHVGWRVGDLLLRAVSGRTEGAVPQARAFARVGCDSFAVLLDPATRDEMAAASAAIVEALAAPFTLAEREIRCTASIGMAWAAGLPGVRSLFRDAETALYEARRQGGDRCVVFAPGAGDASQ
jgi:diguanylate cyclase (GGDEF)-like protein/PAS domain S-box-containing protein